MTLHDLEILTDLSNGPLVDMAQIIKYQKLLWYFANIGNLLVINFAIIRVSIFIIYFPFIVLIFSVLVLYSLEHLSALIKNIAMSNYI